MCIFLYYWCPTHPVLTVPVEAEYCDSFRAGTPCATYEVRDYELPCIVCAAATAVESWTPTCPLSVRSRLFYSGSQEARLIMNDAISRNLRPELPRPPHLM